MAHLEGIGASIHTRLDIFAGAYTLASDSWAGPGARPEDADAWRALFETVDATDVVDNAPAVVANVYHPGNIREFPSFGTPANIVNVPVYGQSTSSQIAGQSDAPEQSYTLNWVATDHQAFESLRANDQLAAFRIRVSNVQDVDGRGAQQFDDFYFYGKIASFELTPALTDSIQAAVSLTIDGDLDGPYSEVGTGGTSSYIVPGITLTS